MMQLHQEYDRFQDMATEIIVIGPEKPPAFKKYFTENELPFIGIPDEHQKVLKLYGQKVNLFKLGRMPGQMLIDQSGILRHVHYGHSMKDIPSNEEIFTLIEGLRTEEPNF